VEDLEAITRVKKEVNEFMENFPLYSEHENLADVS
jgi:hypothetical protein